MEKALRSTKCIDPSLVSVLLRKTQSALRMTSNLSQTIRRVLASCFRLLHFFDQRGHDVEQVADYGIIGNFEDRRFGVFVDGNDRSRAFHADNVLNRTA